MHAQDLYSHARLKAILSQSLGDILSSIKSQAGFFLYLAPDGGEVRFLGIGSKADRGAADHLDELLAPEYPRIFEHPGTEMHDRLFEVVGFLVERSGLSWSQIHRAAVHWLETGGLALGNTIVSQDHPQVIEHWNYQEGYRPLIRTQDALDWAATFDFKLDIMKRERDDTAAYSSIKKTILRVPMAAARQNLVTRQNFRIFLAEHILAFGQEEPKYETTGTSDRQTLTFFLLPVRGLGQWRAAINWIERGSVDRCVEQQGAVVKELEDEASPLARRCLEEMFTLSIIKSFEAAVKEALGPRKETNNREQLARAFSQLWWSREIRFFKDGSAVAALKRTTEERLVYVDDAAAASPAQCVLGTAENAGFLSVDGAGHPGTASIRLRLKALMNSKKDETATIRDEWPFDEAQFSCNLFTRDESELARLSDHLGHVLLDIVEDQTLRRKALNSKRAEVYEGIAHWLKGAISLTGWEDSLETLRETVSHIEGFKHVPKQTAGLIPAIKKAQNTVSLFTLVEGSAGLLRLIGILDRREFRKLEEWFSKQSLDAWESPEAFNEYVDSVVHLTRAIGTARGRPWVEAQIGSEIRRYKEPCTFVPSELCFPPLSTSEGMVPVFALLPGLIEPVLNGLAFLDRISDSREPIRLFFEDHRYNYSLDGCPHILVKVGNRRPSGEYSEPDGIRITRRLFERARLGRLGEGEYDGNCWRIPVQIHPRQLYAFIQDVNRGTWHKDAYAAKEAKEAVTA